MDDPYLEQARQVMRAYPDNLFEGHPAQFYIADLIRAAVEAERERACKIAAEFYDDNDHPLVKAIRKRTDNG